MHSDGLPLTLTGMAVRNLLRRPVRTCLTALGVAVGVMAIVACTTIVRGLQHSIDRTIHIYGTDILVFQANVASNIFSVLDEKKVHGELLAIPEVRTAVGTLWHVLHVERHPFCLVLGMRLSDLGIGASTLIRGRHPRTDDEVMLGSITRRSLGKDVGDTVRIGDERYEVVGVFQTDVVFVNGAIIVSLPRLQRLARKEGMVTSFQVSLRAGADAVSVAREIERRDDRLAAIYDVNSFGKVGRVLEVSGAVTWAVSLVALVVGSIIVANTMWMSVMERTREIGVLRAVGWARRRIVLLILTEAVGVGLVAWLCGSVFGVGLAKLTAWVSVTSKLFHPVFDAPPFVLAAGVAVLLCVVGASAPAWRAAQIVPAEALRYE